MVETRKSPPREMDIVRPAAARIYDAFLGGGHNFGVERGFAERIEQALPGIGGCYQENRAFLRRTVEFLLARGVRQFLDLGSGIPTIGHLHEVARRRTRDFRVLYVDNEPLTVAHSKPLLADEPRADILQADCREPEAIFRSPEARELLDLRRPVGLLMTSVLHFIPDSDDPLGLVETYQDALVPGSHLVISHVTGTNAPEAVRVLADFYAETSDPLHPRETSWIDKLFGDFEILPPGTTNLADWRPDPGRPTSASDRYRLLYGGVARKSADALIPVQPVSGG
ncbi:S-adenosyl methyltransferase [Saccharopolyspora antimicrobica]|uniref:S-adenosyl methyltransferase n=1 Tax=Saccharopolyspora antimicrobica TaxID=455193 RepID=A0A1I5FR02_9PSEU|nr:SAM-dependent methyltransferase [Saccharopolyspora antimicrobica]RKT82277.1 S-adenosyl methyltransferase [Saccharopolyspora antimicrobica]SFO26192.1 S-adenosyl methyltransferase [Saccharopolyspora antimicrobica]